MSTYPRLSNLTELHTHLGASTTTHLLREIAHAQGIKLPYKDYFTFIEHVTINGHTNFENYHTYFNLTHLIQSSPLAIERSVYEMVGLSYRKSTIETLEIRYNPMRRNKDGLYDLDNIIFAAITGMKRAMLQYPIRVGLILEMDRRYSYEQNSIIIQKAIKFAHEGVVGVDVSGPNRATFSMTAHADLFAQARAAGLGITVHTGEATGVDEMREVVEQIKPDRIGHGINCIYDKELMDHLAANNIVLEICPTSNIITGVVADRDKMHQIITTIKEHRIPFCICADGPVFLRTNIYNEYVKLYEKNILTQAEIIAANDIARNASFVNGRPSIYHTKQL